MMRGYLCSLSKPFVLRSFPFHTHLHHLHQHHLSECISDKMHDKTSARISTSRPHCSTANCLYLNASNHRDRSQSNLAHWPDSPATNALKHAAPSNQASNSWHALIKCGQIRCSIVTRVDMRQQNEMKTEKRYLRMFAGADHRRLTALLSKFGQQKTEIGGRTNGRLSPTPSTEAAPPLLCWLWVSVWSSDDTERTKQAKKRNVS
jgi:hypothetical protein